MRYLPTLLLFGVMMLYCNYDVNACPFIQSDDNVPEFQMVSIPTDIATPQERVTYFAEHYWENFDFSDTTFFNFPEVLEQAFVNYMEILPLTSTDIAKASLKASMGRAAVDVVMYKYFLDLYERYLYESDSPFVNGEFFIPVLEAVVEGTVLDDISKIRPTLMLELVLKNRKGFRATDFSFTIDTGKIQTLHEQEAHFLFLLFYNPNCSNCKSVIDYVNGSPFFEAYHESGLLRAVAIYPENNIDEWTEYQSEIPTTWLNGYDHNGSLDQELLYDIKVIPTIYLLDKDKTVLLKDATLEDVISYLKQL